MTADAVAPVDDLEFAARLGALGSFERAPRLAVAVSGGGDSLALTLLADRWASVHGGSVLAVTIDHGLRAESAVEAARVGAWLAARGIAHRVLRWDTATKPATGVQDAARAARRDLLLRLCREERILHLLLAHQRDDQAETLLMRLAADSGRDGLAGMAAIVEADHARILRPLLDVPHARLLATLRRDGQDWIEDPSNRDPRFARIAARAVAVDPDTAAFGFGRERKAREDQVAALLARIAALYPEGWATLDVAGFATAPPELARRALARVLMTIGGGRYGPRGDRLERLDTALRDGTLGGGRTLGGCAIRRARGRIVVSREASAIGPDLAATPGGECRWDGRFALRLNPGPWRVAALGAAGWREVAAADPSVRKVSLPPGVRPVLPALWGLDGVLEVPHLSYRRRDADPDSVGVVSVVFRPRHLLTGAGFAVVSPQDTMREVGFT